ncbi:uncharacterized protein LOC100875174 [Megachile rotundata]|uniref:uncharacterized protein LOC100875174 n=1 Tax=Megachile rotundata TaxID=143995 RepID=UPI003FD65DE3
MISCQMLLFAFVVGFAAAEVPSYITVCGLRNPNLDDCILNSVSSLREKLRQGIPDLDIPPVEPLKIAEMKLTDQPTFKAVATNISISGLLTYHVNHLHYDLKKQQIDLDVRFDNIKLDALYNVDAKILVPINGKGPLTLTTKDAGAKVRLFFKFAERGGKKYVYFSSMTIDLDIKDYDVKFKADNFEQSLQDAIGQALGDSHQEILTAAKPNLEKGISELVLNMANKICTHFTFDELFPDRE